MPPAFDAIIPSLAALLPTARFYHALGVVQAAVALAERHGCCPNRAALAAGLHDVCKAMDRPQLNAYLEGEPVAPHDFDFPAILHGPAGARAARELFGVADAEVLDAIYHHPTGCAAPSPTLQVLMAADFTEPTRQFTGVDGHRAAVRANLRQGLHAILAEKIAHLERKAKPIHPRVYEMIRDLEVAA